MIGNKKIPTTLFTGFLGSGKTTIISHLIDYLQESGEKVAYIKNEIGDQNIDATLIRGKHIVTRELLNGCICCTLTGPFVHAIDELIDTTTPDRIIIEASGAADPSTIALMISSHEKLIRDGVITIIDVVNFEGYKDISYAAREQAKFTDLIVFNKVELADLQRKQAVVGYVRELNEFAPIIEAQNGKLTPQVIFGISTKELELMIKDENTKHHSHLHHAHHLEEDGIQTVQQTVPSSVSVDAVRQILETLPSNVFRVKGVLTTTDMKCYLVNKVGQRITIDEITDPSFQTPVSGSLIYIGFSIKEATFPQFT